MRRAVGQAKQAVGQWWPWSLQGSWILEPVDLGPSHSSATYYSVTCARAPPPTGLPKTQNPPARWRNKKKDNVSYSKQEGEGTAEHQVQRALVQRVQCHPTDCCHHALGHCTSFKPEKTPGECAPTKQWSKPKKKKMQDSRNRERKSQKGKGNSQDQSRGRSQDNTAAGLGTSYPRQDRTEVSGSKVSEKSAGTDWLPDESDLEENYSERLSGDTKKIKAKQIKQNKEAINKNRKKTKTKET